MRTLSKRFRGLRADRAGERAPLGFRVWRCSPLSRRCHGSGESGQRGALGIVLCLLLVFMIGSSSVLAYRNRVTAIPLDSAAVAVGSGGTLVEVSGC